MGQTKPPRPVGRPKTGKRSNPVIFRQVSAWIRRDTYDRVSIRLIREDRREFSDLVQALLEDWLHAR